MSEKKDFDVSQTVDKAQKVFGNFGVSVSRGVHKAMAKIGKAETTRDIPYDQAKYQCQQNAKKLKQIAIHVEKISELMHTVLVVQDEIYNEFEALYKMEAEGGRSLGAYKEALTRIGEARETMEKTYASEISTPIRDYLVQYEIMAKRMEELEDRRVDMDRHYDKLIKLTEKTKGTKDNLPKVDATYKQSKAMHDCLHGEVMGDFPKLQEDLVPFLTPIVGEFSRATATFWTSTGQAYTSLASSANNIPSGSQHGYPPVITPPERSMMLYRGGPGGAPAPAPLESSGPSTTATTMSSSTMSSTTMSSTTTAKTTPGGGASYSATATTPGAQPRQQPVPPSKSAGPQARALYTFNAQESGELSFKKGDVIRILSKDGDWWQGELNGMQGVLPANYVTMI